MAVKSASDKNDSVFVDGKEYVIGKPTPRHIAAITQFIGDVQLRAKKKIKKEDLNPGDFFPALLSVLSADDLIALAALVIGCDKKFAEDNFDFEWVAPAIAITIEKANIGAIFENFTRIASLVTREAEESEESSEPQE
ncbi:MAG: hypothetical protein HC944_02830 [Nanoarchaeota archaeon]|nr:hypothetical protein [Nanoarchaeota archaeon]